MVVIVDGVDSVDGGCAYIVSGSVAALRGVLSGLTKVWVAISLALGVVWVLSR